MGWMRQQPIPQAPAMKARKKSRVAYDGTVITLDFETYYDVDYTLRKLSTSEYIRDPRFEAIICVVKIGDGDPLVAVGAKEMKRLFAKIDWTKADLLCHNTMFDGLIMSEHFGVVPRRYLDTLAMARGLFGNDTKADLDTISLFLGHRGKVQGVLDSAVGLHLADLVKRPNWEQYKGYCIRDVEECRSCFDDMLQLLPLDELTKIDIFIRAFCDPVIRVDRPRVQKELKRELTHKDDVFMSAVGSKLEQTKLILMLGRQGAIDHAKKEIGKTEVFAEMLRTLGVEPPMKSSPTDHTKMIYAFSKTDEDFLILQEHGDKRVRDLVEARLEVKSVGNITKAGRFLKASEGGKRLPIALNYYAAHTGRPGGGNKMNMLNLERGGELRRSMLAPEGQVIVVADSGQIEARVAMWIADQLDMLEEFRVSDRKEDRDPYCKMADDVYGFKVEKDKNPKERFVGKVLKLGLQYQMGPPRLQTTLALGALGGEPMFVELDECQRFVYVYRKKHNKVVKFWDVCRDIIQDMVRGREGSWKCISWEHERIWLPNGMSLKYPGIKEKHGEDGSVNWTYMRKGKESKIYGGLLTENLVQALANVIVTEQMMKIAEKYRIVTMTYDEVVWLANKKDAKKAFDYGMKIMMEPPKWAPELPLMAEGGWDVNYSK